MFQFIFSDKCVAAMIWWYCLWWHLAHKTMLLLFSEVVILKAQPACSNVAQEVQLRLSLFSNVLFSAHTHTQRFNGPFPGLPRWSGTRKVKPIWILLKQETVSGSGISWAVCKSAPRSRQITTPAPHHSVLLQTRCPSCCPTNSVKALKVLLIALRTYSHFVLANNAVQQPRLLFFVEQESSLFSMLSRFADQTCKTVSLLFLWLIDMVSSLAQEWCHLAAFWLALKANLFNIAFSF